MKPKERQAYILEKVREENFASVEELSKIFKVTVQSIRKDINNLCKKGLLRRIYGGVEIPVKDDNLSYTNRKIFHYEEKKIIAKLVAKQIPNNCSIFFSIGTTPEIIAKELLNHKNLKIYTNNLNVALVLCENSDFEIILQGGLLRNKYADTVHDEKETFFENIKADYGIFGVGAISNDGSLLDFTKGEIKARNIINKNSNKTFLVADNSKFNRKANIKNGHITDVDLVFTDTKPPQTIMKLLKDKNINIIFSDESN